LTVHACVTVRKSNVRPETPNAGKLSRTDVEKKMSASTNVARNWQKSSASVRSARINDDASKANGRTASKHAKKPTVRRNRRKKNFAARKRPKPAKPASVLNSYAFAKWFSNISNLSPVEAAGLRSSIYLFLH